MPAGSRSAAFSPDGSKIVTASDDATARLWEADSCRQIGTLTGHAEAIFSATFSPRGQAIVTASADRTARLWDAGSGRPLATLNGHTDRVRSARFSPDGSKIVTASHDRTARIWRALPTTEDLVAYVNEVVPGPLTPEERDRLLFGN